MCSKRKILTNFKSFANRKTYFEKNFLIECTIINNQIQYRIERTIINSNVDFIKYNLNNEKLLIFNNDELRLKFIQLIHDTFIVDHFEITKIYKIFIRNYFWINIMNTIKQFIRNCHICRRKKLFRNKYFETFRFLFVFEVRWSNISINFVIKLFKNKNLWKVKCENIIIIVNKLSKQTYVKFIDELILERITQVFYYIFWKIHNLFENYVSSRNI